MFRAAAGSTAQLLQLCAGYFASYVATGVLVKYFVSVRDPKLSEMSFLVNNTLGSAVSVLIVIVLLGWLRLKSNRMVRCGPLRLPVEAAYIIPSGVCTAVVIPTTTLMYTLPISVMVAMVIMRGSVIVISRAVDAIQIAQGILKKRVYAEENWAVVFAILAVAAHVVLLPLVAALEARGVPIGKSLGLNPAEAKGSFDFLGSRAAVTILGSYIAAYSIRIYLMNYFKNTRAKGIPQDNKGFFAIEQVAAGAAMVIGTAWILSSAPTETRVIDVRAALSAPTWTAIVSGIPYGLVAFFSVFLFMFQGRTATFAGLVNRLTSLLAGTTATLLGHAFFRSSLPSARDWISMAFILIAVAFLTRAERHRVAELAAPAAR
ncbi:MAG: hypothetical protein U0167_09485 [bacterium]